MTKEIKGNIHSYSKEKLKLQKNRTLRREIKYLIIIILIVILVWLVIK